MVVGIFVNAGLCVSVCTGFISVVCFSQGSEGPPGPRGQPGDAVSVNQNTHTHTHTHIIYD